MIPGEDQYRGGSGGGGGGGTGGSSSGSPPASLLVVPQPLTVKPSHPSHLNSHLGGGGGGGGGSGGGSHTHPPRKYQCKMCPQVSTHLIYFMLFFQLSRRSQQCRQPLAPNRFISSFARTRAVDARLKSHAKYIRSRLFPLQLCLQNKVSTLPAFHETYLCSIKQLSLRRVTAFINPSLTTSFRHPSQ